MMLTALVTSGCQDLTIPSDSPARMVRAFPPAPDGRDVSEDPRYVCFTSELAITAGHPYRWAHVALRFPKADVPADGRTGILRLRVLMPGRSTPVAMANCRIPRSKAAVERLYRRFASIFAGRARLDPLVFVEPSSEHRLYLSGVRAQVSVSGSGPSLDSAPGDWQMPGVTATVSQHEGGATGWTGQTEWGWGSAGDYYQSGGGDSYDPGTPTDSPASLADDFDTIPKLTPNCAAPQNRQEFAFCHSVVPDSLNGLLDLTERALARIRARGAACAEIADKGEQLLAQGDLRYFQGSENPALYGNAGGFGTILEGVALDSDYWLRFYNSRDSAGRTFDNGLAHEIEHSLGRDHVDDPYAPGVLTTAHARACGG